MSGAKIIKAIEEATRGDFSRITTHGHVWIRDGVDKAEAWDAVAAARADEREKCAKIAENEVGTSDGAGEVYIARKIADTIRRRSPQVSATENNNG
jgi:hypothetical protein